MEEVEKVRRRTNEVGPIGARVAENVRRLRANRGLSTTQISRLLGEVGRPIQPTGITKIEKQERKVDADDLIALAVVLGVNPNALLLPPVADMTEVEVTAAGVFPAEKVWNWVDGREPLKAAFDEDDLADFQIHARPKGRRRYYLPGERSEEELAKKRAADREIARRMNPGDPEGEAASLAVFRRLDREAWAEGE
ncbi:helix-turn-helix transcriptional regulator [Streptosporangium sp. NPDC051022]|uniref:helix-turn-helix domain-containing protein n=1 Tax=Streptosporangium sp. NPDC051022 TaxID=3155752 RepID=UPI00344164BA